MSLLFCLCVFPFFALFIFFYLILFLMLCTINEIVHPEKLFFNFLYGKRDVQVSCIALIYVGLTVSM